jgi:hypothetical protein
MACTTTNKNQIFVLTCEQVNKGKCGLFNGRSLQVPVEELSKWPLRDYLWAAVMQAAHLDGLREETERSWQTPAWDFGRFAKAHPLLIDLDENDALAEITKTIGSEFWENPLHMDRADAEMAFDDIWEECRAVPGYDRLTTAVLAAKEAACRSGQDGPAGYTTFLAVARHLYYQSPDTAFMLPCHKLSSMLACLPMTISRYRKKAIRDGRIKVVKNHVYRSAGVGEATEFAYVGNRVADEGSGPPGGSSVPAS